MKEKEICTIDGCGQAAKVAGLCGACYSWWNRCRHMSGAEFGGYLATAKFRAERMLSRLTRTNINRNGKRRKAA